MKYEVDNPLRTDMTDMVDTALRTSQSINRPMTRFSTHKQTGQVVGKSAGLVKERLQVRIPAGAAGEFSSPELTLCALTKDPCHSAKSAGGRLHLNTYTPSAKRSRSGLTIPLSRHSVRTYPEIRAHATYQGKFGHSRLSSLSHCGLNMT